MPASTWGHLRRKLEADPAQPRFPADRDGSGLTGWRPGSEPRSERRGTVAGGADDHKSVTAVAMPTASVTPWRRWPTRIRTVPVWLDIRVAGGIDRNELRRVADRCQIGSAGQRHLVQVPAAAIDEHGAAIAHRDQVLIATTPPTPTTPVARFR